MAGQQEETTSPASPETSEHTDSHSSYVLVEQAALSVQEPEQTKSATQQSQSEELGSEGDNSEQSKPYCSFFQEGKCRFGDSCFNLHEADPNYKPPKKQKQRNRKQKKSSTSEEDETKRKQKKKLRTVMDVVHRIQWDEQYRPEDFIVGYLDRFALFWKTYLVLLMKAEKAVKNVLNDVEDRVFFRIFGHFQRFLIFPITFHNTAGLTV